MSALVRILRVSDVEGFAARVSSAGPGPEVARRAASIVAGVRRRGDAGVLRYEEKFGAARPERLRLTIPQIRAARRRVPGPVIAAIRASASRLAAAESALMRSLRPARLSSGGVRLEREFVPLRSVGCYVPGGLASYPSSAVMSVVPARIAGVKRIAVATPPGRGGMPSDAAVAAADICGATEIYCMGGAQAVAALAYGTRTVGRVDKIVGPGGAYVEAAKSLVSGHTPADMTAGPTELGIAADSSASPRHIALDMASQAEHSADASCFLATSSARLASQVDNALIELAVAATRSGIMQASLAKNAFIAVCRSRRDAVRLVELLAPEHAQIMTRNAARDAAAVRSAGLVLLGDTPSAASDYMLGSNHILPTRRGGRVRGPLSVLDFVKMRATARASRRELGRIMPHVAALAGAEGLDGHADAVSRRLL